MSLLLQEEFPFSRSCRDQWVDERNFRMDCDQQFDPVMKRSNPIQKNHELQRMDVPQIFWSGPRMLLLWVFKILIFEDSESQGTVPNWPASLPEAMDGISPSLEGQLRSGVIQFLPVADLSYPPSYRQVVKFRGRFFLFSPMFSSSKT